METSACGQVSAILPLSLLGQLSRPPCPTGGVRAIVLSARFARPLWIDKWAGCCTGILSTFFLYLVIADNLPALAACSFQPGSDRPPNSSVLLLCPHGFHSCFLCLRWFAYFTQLLSLHDPPACSVHVIPSTPSLICRKVPSTCSAVLFRPPDLSNIMFHPPALPYCFVHLLCLNVPFACFA
jgi:hypothetical protein